MTLTTRSHLQTCTICEASCGIIIEVKDNHVKSIKGDKNDPFSRGHICPKATALKDIHEDEDRLRTPVKRSNGGWQKISWEEAFDLVATRLIDIRNNYGANAIATYAGNPNVHNLGAMLYLRGLQKSLRTRNMYSATSVDQLPHHVAAHYMYGHQLLIPVPDIDHTDFLLIIGGNPLVSNGSIMTSPDIKKRLKAIITRGGEIVVIDPKRTATAKLATEHHFIQPGTDVLLVMAMLNVIISDKLINPRALQPLLSDWSDLQQRIRDYTPEKVADIVGIDAATIRKLSHKFASATTAGIYSRLGASVQEFGGLTTYIINVLNVVTGRTDAVGGMMFTTPAADILPTIASRGFGRTKTRVRELPSFQGELPVSALAEEMLTPGEKQIKALVVAAGNPVLSTPNGTQLAEAIRGLEFSVAIDFYINETNALADVILPPVGPLEHDHYDLLLNILAIRNRAKYSTACFDKPDGQLHDWEIYAELTKRLTSDQGLRTTATNWATEKLGPKRMLDALLRTGPYGQVDPADIRKSIASPANLLRKLPALRQQIAQGLSVSKLMDQPHGIDLGALKPVLPARLFTKSNKIEFATDIFLPDIDRVDQVFFANKQEANSHEFGWQLIGRRNLRSNNSWLHNSTKMTKGDNRCTVQISSEDSNELSIKNGQLIVVRSRVGSVTLPAEICDDIVKGVVSIPHGWGHTNRDASWQHALRNAGVSVNDLTDDARIDRLTGNGILNGVPVDISVLN